ncbi:MAG: beta-galactosidase [Phycisphaerae bacterium]|nr:beta-galactosidase [Phycisphaerae bacterium]
MISFPHFPKRKVHCLDGVWDFAFLEDVDSPASLSPASLEFTHRMPVPGVFDAYPDFAGRRGTGVYRTFISVAPNTKGLLNLQGLGMWAAVFVDGELIREIPLPYSGVTVVVPASAQARRELVIVTDNRFDAERVPLFETIFDFYGYGGVYRSVIWHELPAVGAIERVRISTLDLKQGRVRARVEYLQEPATQNPSFAVDGEPVEPVEITREGNTLTAVLDVPDPACWSPASPHLHLLTVSGGEDEIVERFGLRTVEAKGKRILLNGEPIQLLGFCRHEAHPQHGPALPMSQLAQDLQLLKAMGCNFVRGSHYPQDPRFLDLCDEMGMLVWEESLGWGQVDAVAHSAPRFIDLQEQQTRLMVRNSYNHPCVILWGFLNECGSHRKELAGLYERLIAAIREEDAGRLVTYASNHPYEDLHFSLCDVVSINTYPGWYAHDIDNPNPLQEIPREMNKLCQSLSERNLDDRPLIISEIGAGAIYGWRDPCAFHWSEGYQSEYLKTVCEIIVGSEDFAGLALWQFCDIRTYPGARALTRPRAFNNKGIVDEYRRPKLAFETVKDLFTRQT